MTEIQCPACSALLNLALSLPGSELRRSANDEQAVIADSPPRLVQPVSAAEPRRETAKLAEFNAELADVLREFLAVHPWEGHRLPGDIHSEFIAWLRGAPDERGFWKFLVPRPVTKNRISKLLVSEIGATFYKGPKGREYRLPEQLQPAGGDEALAVARAELSGEGSLKVEGVTSLPLAEHVAAVKAQAAAEDAAEPEGLPEFVYVVKDGVRHKVPLKSPGDVAALVEEDAMQEPVDYSLPEGTFVDGPTIFPVDGGAAPAEPSGSWWVYLTDAEADLEPESLEQVALARLPERLVLAGAPLLRFDMDGAPYLQCAVHSVDGAPAGTGEVRVPLPWLKEDEAEAAAAPLPSSAALAAVAGHEALERARAHAAGPAPVFLAAEDLDSYEGADPGDWG